MIESESNFEIIIIVEYPVKVKASNMYMWSTYNFY